MTTTAVLTMARGRGGMQEFVLEFTNHVTILN